MHRNTIGLALGWFSGVLAVEVPALLWLVVLSVCAGLTQRTYHIACVVGVIACISGIIRNESHHHITMPPRHQLTNMTLHVRDQKNTWQQQQIILTDQQHQHYLAKLPLEPQYPRGSVVTISAGVTPWELPYNDYHAQLRRQRIIGELHTVTVHNVVIRGTIVADIERTRRFFWSEIHRHFPEPVASVVAGMLLGVTGDVQDKTAAAFRLSGTSHILVISGWNITIVAALCLAIVKRINPHRYVALGAPLLVIALYVIFTGASAAVIRAGVMGSIIVIGKWINRPRSMVNIIVIAVILISFVDPAALWDIGMQLSTLATVGLIAFATPVERLLSKSLLASPHLDWAREGLASTIAAQITTLPIMICRLDVPTLWSLFANTIITPVVPLAMACGTVFLLATLIHPSLAYGTAWIAYPSFAWIVTGSHVIATWPTFMGSIPDISAPWIEGCLHLLWMCAWYLTHIRSNHLQHTGNKMV